MRKINEIIIHCSATIEGKNYTTDDINRWHLHRGFAMIGYHYVVYLDGSIHGGRKEEKMGAHCVGHNANSIGICYIGGLDKKGKSKDTRTEAQKKAIAQLVSMLLKKYPGATIHGHNEFAAKDCPCFNVKKEFSTQKPK